MFQLSRKRGRKDPECNVQYVKNKRNKKWQWISFTTLIKETKKGWQNLNQRNKKICSTQMIYTSLRKITSLFC